MEKAKEAHGKVVPVLEGTFEDAKEMKENHGEWTSQSFFVFFFCQIEMSLKV